MFCGSHMTGREVLTQCMQLGADRSCWSTGTTKAYKIRQAPARGSLAVSIKHPSLFLYFLLQFNPNFFPQFLVSLLNFLFPISLCQSNLAALKLCCLFFWFLSDFPKRSVLVSLPILFSDLFVKSTYLLLESVVYSNLVPTSAEI